MVGRRWDASWWLEGFPVCEGVAAGGVGVYLRRELVHISLGSFVVGKRSSLVRMRPHRWESICWFGGLAAHPAGEQSDCGRVVVRWRGLLVTLLSCVFHG